MWKWKCYFLSPILPSSYMALFSRISTFCSPSLSVLTKIALATDVMGMDIAVGNTEENAPRNFRAIHSAGLLSCLSTRSTLQINNQLWATEQMMVSKYLNKQTCTTQICMTSEITTDFIPWICNSETKKVEGLTLAGRWRNAQSQALQFLLQPDPVNTPVLLQAH